MENARIRSRHRHPSLRLYTRAEYSSELKGLAEIAIDRIRQKFPGSEVRLFGSVAKGRATASSDIDLAVFLPLKEESRHALSGKIQRCLLDIACQNEVAFDIAVFDKKFLDAKEDNCSSTLLREILFYE